MIGVHRILRKVPRILQKAAAGPFGDRVTLVWDGAPAPGDPMVQGSYSAPSPQSQTVDAFVEYVQAKTVARDMLNFQQGDALVTFLDPTVLDGRRNLYFILRSRVRLPGCSVVSGQKGVTCADTTGLCPGALILGSNVPAGALVESVESATGFTLTLAATGTASALGFTADVRKDYVQASTGRGIEENWDVVIDGRAVGKKILLRLRGPSVAPVAVSAGEPAGIDPAWPSEPVVAADEIRVIDTQGTAVAYRWDGARFLPGAASAGTALAARAKLVPLNAGIELVIGGTVAARFTPIEGLDAEDFTDVAVSASPRIEFWFGGALVAALTQEGTFYAENMSDDAQPADGMAFRDALGRWLFTINADGITTPFGSD